MLRPADPWGPAPPRTRPSGSPRASGSRSKRWLSNVREQVGASVVGAIKPNPSSELNHFTVPVGIVLSFCCWICLLFPTSQPNSSLRPCEMGASRTLYYAHSVHEWRTRKSPMKNLGRAGATGPHHARNHLAGRADSCRVAVRGSDGHPRHAPTGRIAGFPASRSPRRPLAGRRCRPSPGSSPPDLLLLALVGQAPPPLLAHLELATMLIPSLRRNRGESARFDALRGSFPDLADSVARSSGHRPISCEFAVSAAGTCQRAVQESR